MQRESFTVCAINDSEMIIFGGLNQTWIHKNYAVYDIETDEFVTSSKMEGIFYPFYVEENNCFRQKDNSVLFLTSGDDTKFELY